MSTLNFDALNNQSLSGMSLSEQSWNTSNLFTDASLASTSYGSGQFRHLLEDLEKEYACPEPTLYNDPVVGTNNNSETHKVPSTSSVCEEDLDDEEADGILSNLPSSCQDFEAKEMHIRLERNQSSPLVAGHISPAQSSKLSSGCQSVEPPQEPADAEDLEVQWINESFEEQQKATLMYQSGDLKTLFYQGSDHESSKAPTRSSTEKSYCSPVDRPERLPYVKKLLSQDSSGSLHEGRPITPTHLKPEHNFQPLLTPKSDAILQQQVRKKPAIKSRRVSEPLARKPKSFWSNPDFVDSLSDTSTGGNDVFDVGETAGFQNLQDSSRHVSFAEDLLTTPVAQRDCDTATNDQTEVLAKGIVESLFVGWTPTESVAPSFPVKLSKPLSARKLDMENVPENPAGFEAAPRPESNPTINQEEEEEEDSWDTIDEETLSRQVQELKVTAAATAKQQVKKPINYFEAPPPSWDSTVIPHVLEAFSIPEYKMQEDVVQALEEMGYGTAIVKWVERKIVFVSFMTEKQAKDALILSKHPWLRLRSLVYSPINVQKMALEQKKALEPKKNRPKTHVGVARRMVEGALGVKANVSQEKKQVERHELSEARAAKKSAVKWDD